MAKNNDIKYSELKYRQLLKDHKRLAEDLLINIKTNGILQSLICDLADHMNLKDIGKLAPEEIVQSAKDRITKIHLVS